MRGARLVETVRPYLDRVLRVAGYRLFHDPGDGTGLTVRPLRGRSSRGIPLPPGAAEVLRWDNPWLRALADRYATMAGSPLAHYSVWTVEHRTNDLDLPWFRGDNAFLWQIRQVGRQAARKYRRYAAYLTHADRLGLIERLGEDGAFGAWTFRTADGVPISRDLLDSVNEIYFLDRALGLLDRSEFSMVDVGAGYGRTAVRMVQAAPGLSAYLCADAVPESTFLCDYYLRYRKVGHKARAVPLDRLSEECAGVRPLVGVAVHSLSEMSTATVDAWVGWLARDLDTPYLLVVSNEADRLMASEDSHRRVDALPVLERHGYMLKTSEPMITDPDVRSETGIDDHFLLFGKR